MLYKTGEKAPSTANYDFVMHLEGTTNCTSDEKRIHLEKGGDLPAAQVLREGLLLAARGVDYQNGGGPSILRTGRILTSPGGFTNLAGDRKNL